MDLVSVVILIILAALTVALLWLAVGFRRLKDENKTPNLEAAFGMLKSELLEKQMEGLISLRESLDSATRVLNERLAEGSSTLDKRLALFTDIENKLGHLEAQTSNIENIGRNISSLSELLQPPQLRGGLGEILLENLLGQILPRALFETQYRMSDGQRVDAVVKLADRLLPIDSKFPLESYQRVASDQDSKEAQKEFFRTLRKHIDSISSKYLKPEEGTTDIAVMYIPSEAVYSQFVSENIADGLEYALSKRVIPSSPGHLWAFLASLSATFAQMGLAGDSRRLVAGLNNLSASFSRLERLHERIESSIRALSQTVPKAKEELGGMVDELKHLQEPSQPADDPVRPA